MICEECGFDFDPKKKFCPECGGRVSDEILADIAEKERLEAIEAERQEKARLEREAKEQKEAEERRVIEEAEAQKRKEITGKVVGAIIGAIVGAILCAILQTVNYDTSRMVLIVIFGIAGVILGASEGGGCYGAIGGYLIGGAIGMFVNWLSRTWVGYVLIVVILLFTGLNIGKAIASNKRKNKKNNKK